VAELRPPPAVRAVFVDALGTLVELQPPWEHLRAAVPPELDDRRLVAAVRAEMSYYRAHAHEGRDPESLAELRARCAGVLSEALGVEVGVEELLAAVRFDAYPDAAPALVALQARGLPVVVVSNWDCSLGSVLERCGLAPYLAGAVSSAEAGARKPDPAIFAPALELADCGPEESLHVGDTPHEDLEAARAAGIRALLIDRQGTAADDDGTLRISSLAQIEDHL
jgi:putative hydrolase of the HAD superfamily